MSNKDFDAHQWALNFFRSTTETFVTDGIFTDIFTGQITKTAFDDFKLDLMLAFAKLNNTIQPGDNVNKLNLEPTNFSDITIDQKQIIDQILFHTCYSDRTLDRIIADLEKMTLDKIVLALFTVSILQKEFEFDPPHPDDFKSEEKTE